jgi:hypothetical protein
VGRRELVGPLEAASVIAVRGRLIAARDTDEESIVHEGHVSRKTYVPQERRTRFTERTNADLECDSGPALESARIRTPWRAGAPPPPQRTGPICTWMDPEPKSATYVLAAAGSRAEAVAIACSKKSAVFPETYSNRRKSGGGSSPLSGRSI